MGENEDGGDARRERMVRGTLRKGERVLGWSDWMCVDEDRNDAGEVKKNKKRICRPSGDRRMRVVG